MHMIQRRPARRTAVHGWLIAAPMLHSQTALAFTWGESDWGGAFWGVAGTIEGIPALPAFALAALLVGVAAIAARRLHRYRPRGARQ